MRNRKHNAGITLLDVLISLTIIAILSTVAAPLFDNMIGKNAIRGAVSQMNASVEYARSEAVSTQSAISICSTENSRSCSGNTEWSKGFLVFEDVNKDGDLSTDDCPQISDCILRIIQLGSHRLSASSSESWVGFLSNGARNTAGAETIEFCDRDAGQTTDIFTLKFSAAGSKSLKKSLGRCL